MNCDYNCNGYVNNPFGCGGCNTCAIHLLWVALVATIQDVVGLQLF